MNVLAEATGLQQRALSDLQHSREASVAWCDEPRHRLDRQILEPLAGDGRRLLEALRKAAGEISSAENMLS